LLRDGAAGAEVDAAVGEDVEGGGALGDADGVVEGGREEGDAVAEADLLRALAAAKETSGAEEWDTR
jgi:hypothetical protein